MADIKDTLDLCLDRILKGESIEQCIADYPDQAEELAPILASAVRLYPLQGVRPSESGKAKARSRMEQALVERRAKKYKAPLAQQWLVMFARPVGLALLAIALLTTGAGATVAAASDSLPDGTLYPIKRTTESVRLALTFGDVEKARLHASYANRRAREMAVMASKQNFNDMDSLQNNLEQHLISVQKIVSNGPQDAAAAPNLSAPSSSSNQSEISGMRADDKTSASEIVDLRVRLAAQGINSIARIEVIIPTAPPEQQVLLRNMVNFMRETYSATLIASGSDIPKELRTPAE